MNALMAIAMVISVLQPMPLQKPCFIQRIEDSFVSDKTDNLVHMMSYAHHPTEIMRYIKRLENYIQ
jgi:hypothetical protein